MKKFYQSVDMRSRKAMINFLEHHFRYFTMNSWNGSQSYACNLKIHNLGLDTEIADQLYDLLDVQEFFDLRRDLLDAFNEEHQYLWQAGMNGRSGGYLVLYQGTLVQSEYQSYCTQCGQRNYGSVTETGSVCGVCGKPARVDYTRRPMLVQCFPGRGTDDDADFEDWELYALRERVKLVQELDKLADDIVSKSIQLIKEYTVEEEEYFVPQTRKVLVPAGI